jgi:hypothetical protein
MTNEHTLAAAHLTAITRSVKQWRAALYISLCTLEMALPMPEQTYKKQAISNSFNMLLHIYCEICLLIALGIFKNKMHWNDKNGFLF